MEEIKYGELHDRDAERIKAQKIADTIASLAVFQVQNFVLLGKLNWIITW